MVNVSLTRKGKYAPPDLLRELQKLTDAKRLPDRLAQAFMVMLKKNIEENAYGFTLSKFWERIKAQKGWDEQPFMAQGHYLNLLEIVTRDGHLTVGFRAGTKHPRSGMSMGELAFLLEYGRLDKNLPARPLWRNTIRDFFAVMDKDVKLEIKNILKNARRI